MGDQWTDGCQTCVCEDPTANVYKCTERYCTSFTNNHLYIEGWLFYLLCKSIALRTLSLSPHQHILYIPIFLPWHFQLGCYEDTIRPFYLKYWLLLYTNIDQKLVNSLHGLLICEIGGLDSRVITTEYRTRVHCIHMWHLFCNALVHGVYSGVSGQCSHTKPSSELRIPWVSLK